MQHLRTASRPATILYGLGLLTLLGVAVALVVADRVNPAGMEAAPAQVPPNAPEGRAARQEAQGAAGIQSSGMSQEVGQVLADVAALLDGDKLTEAAALLQSLLQPEALEKLSRYEQSRALQQSFNLNIKAGKFAAALADLEAALQSGGLDAQETIATEYQIGQLYLQTEDYGSAALHLKRWQDLPGVTPSQGSLYLLSAAYYYLDQYEQAIPVMERALAVPGVAQEAHYSMMASLYIQTEAYAKAKPVLEKMVELYGDQTYRDQLAGINAQLDKAL
jgi:tetratricopeptide (TPR) repeat protein